MNRYPPKPQNPQEKLPCNTENVNIVRQCWYEWYGGTTVFRFFDFELGVRKSHASLTNQVQHRIERPLSLLKLCFQVPPFAQESRNESKSSRMCANTQLSIISQALAVVGIGSLTRIGRSANRSPGPTYTSTLSPMSNGTATAGGR